MVGPSQVPSKHVPASMQGLASSVQSAPPLMGIARHSPVSGWHSPEVQSVLSAGSHTTAVEGSKAQE